MENSLAPLPQKNIENNLRGEYQDQGLIELKTNEYLERQKIFESNARSYPRRIPLALEKASGIYVKNTQGQIFIDCLAGAGTLALGHNHPNLITGLKKLLDSGLPLHTLDLTTPVKDQFVADIFATLPAVFSEHAKIQFCGPTGADAVEAAIKLAKIATGRRTVFSFSGGYHGMTNGALSLMGNLGPKAAVPGLMSDVQFLPFPYSYRCPFGLEHEQSVDINLNYIKHLLNDPESGVLKPAAIIVEAVQGEGGVIPAPVSWLKGLRELTNQHDIPLIIDEVQTGIGRTGKMFAFEHAGISPDMVVLSKAIGGGLPMSVLLYNKKWDKWQAGAHAGTFRGNQMAMAAGSITLDTIRQQGLVDNATKMGERLTNRLYELKDKHAFIGDVRGLGLMIGVEIIDPESASSIGGQFSTNPSLTSKLQQACLSQGLIIELGGRDSSVIRFLPPLIINAAEVDLVAAKFTQAIDMIISRDQIKLATA
ncbi:MAG: diaminobutyrate--2-oxoglutarate transaminase [Cycloclasticus sp.]|jgi:2,4-diaminobutyrate 4-transaminases